MVLGQGPTGLALTRLCALSGAGRLIVTDAREAPFSVSRGYGATDCVDVSSTDARQAVWDLTAGEQQRLSETHRGVLRPGVRGWIVCPSSG